VIDRQGIVQLVFSALFASADHVRKALAAVQEAGRAAGSPCGRRWPIRGSKPACGRRGSPSKP